VKKIEELWEMKQCHANNYGISDVLINMWMMRTKISDSSKLQQVRSFCSTYIHIHKGSSK